MDHAFDDLPNKKNEKEGAPLLISSEREAADRLASLFEQTKAHIEESESLTDWAQANPSQHIPALDRMIAERCEQGAPLTLAVLMLLGNINSHRPHMAVEDELAYALATHNVVREELLNELHAMMQLSDIRARVSSHKILDFLRTYIRAMQNDTGKKLGTDGDSLGICAETFIHFSEYELNAINNYLLARHCQDIVEMRDFFTSDKSDALHGVAGGAEDETIYTHAHAEESSINRVRLDFYDRSLLVKPVLALAPGYLGVYYHGYLTQVYRKEHMTEPKFSDAQLVRMADPDNTYDRMYDELNAPSRSGRPSMDLRKLNVIWEQFPQRKPFFFDVTRIAMESLHPIVRSEIYMRNEEFRALHRDPSRVRPSPLTIDEFAAELFPDPRMRTTEQTDLYIQFSSLSMRKKIKDDFDITLADYHPWVQRNFLTYLERTSLDDARELWMFVKRFGSDGLTSFLATEDDAVFGETLLSIGERFGTAAQPVLARYAELANAAYAAGDAVREQYGNTRDISEPTIHAIQNNILKRGKALLIQLAQSEPKHGTDGEPLLPDSVWRAYERISAGAILFASTFQQLRGQGVDMLAMENTEFLALLGGQDGGIEEGERHAMIRITDDNYPPMAEVGSERGYSDAFRNERITELREALDNPTTMFYLYKHENGDVIAFCRFDILAKGRLRFASMHVNPEYQGNKIGEALIQKTVDDWAHDHVIEAHCDARTSIVRHYIEHGFVGIGYELSHLGVPALSLERDDRTPYESKQFTAPEIIQRSRRHEEGDDIIVEEYQSTDQFSRLNDVYVLTRFSRAGEKEYCVFETKY